MALEVATARELPGLICKRKLSQPQYYSPQRLRGYLRTPLQLCHSPSLLPPPHIPLELKVDLPVNFT